MSTNGGTEHMSEHDLRDAVPDGEALRYRAETRGGGEVGLTDERLLVDDGTVVAVPLENLESVDVRSVDWFLVVMSLVLAAVGVLAAGDHLLGGLALVAAGLASLYVTYRKRGQVTINTHTRAKPVQVHLDDTEEFRERVKQAVDRFEARRDVDDGGGEPE